MLWLIFMVSIVKAKIYVQSPSTFDNYEKLIFQLPTPSLIDLGELENGKYCIFKFQT